MSIVVFDIPIPVKTPLGDAYAIYVYHNGMYDDDEWTCAMMEDGQVRHFVSSQIKLWNNQTYGILKKEKNELKASKETTKDSKSNRRRKTSRGS
ncbi:MAG TPA: hypothetical protein VIY47_14945 [Ignavibacteriaceae bacterium]